MKKLYIFTVSAGLVLLAAAFTIALSPERSNSTFIVGFVMVSIGAFEVAFPALRWVMERL